MFYEATSKFWKLELISTQQGKLRGRYVLNHYVLEQNTKPIVFNSMSCAIVRLKRALGLLNRPASFQIFWYILEQRKSCPVQPTIKK